MLSRHASSRPFSTDLNLATMADTSGQQRVITIKRGHRTYYVSQPVRGIAQHGAGDNVQDSARRTARCRTLNGRPMPTPSVTLILLISAPSDVPAHDIAIVQRAVSEWNVSNGLHLSPAVTVVPVSWGEHVHSVVGIAPQDAINRQIVDFADVGIALFANRLGTPTTNHESGTVEEIETLAGSGVHVSVLRRLDVSLPPGEGAAVERQRLDAWFEKKRGDALYREYTNPDDVAREIRQVLASQGRAASRRHSPDAPPSDPSDWSVSWGGNIIPNAAAQLEPRIETRGTETVLVLPNPFKTPITDVAFEFRKDDGTPSDFALRAIPNSPIKRIAPDTELSVKLLRVAESADEAECHLTWTTSDGNQHEHTVYLYAT